MDDLIFLVKKYIVFLSYFMYMYPLKDNGRTLITGLDRCRCGNSQRMITFLFNFDNSTRVVYNNNNTKVSDYIYSKIKESNLYDKPLFVQVHLGLIDHTFVINIYKGQVSIYQSYIDVNPLIITKLDSLYQKELFNLLDKLGSMSGNPNKIHLSHRMMETMIRLFGVSSTHIKFEFDDYLIINTKIADPMEFYGKLIDICNIYYNKFVKLNKFVNFGYLKPSSIEHTKHKLKDQRTDDKLVEEFDGDMLYYEYYNLVKELTTIEMLKNNEVVKNLYKLLETNKKFSDAQSGTNLDNIDLGEWKDVIDFVYDDKDIETIEKAISLQVLDKMDPASALKGKIEKEFKRVTEHGINYESIYQKYKNRYKLLKN